MMDTVAWNALFATPPLVEVAAANAYGMRFGAEGSSICRLEPPQNHRNHRIALNMATI
jgi:hypothetical protein